ncbi:response regulator transcription factor [Burkholderia pseudomultivorans]|uniref:LuxR family transcriptional regulator n=1 Tax=Burkholderia pseudomultivorans TaxID=1207504 RepID=A0A132EYU4_9BURK|nr:response regulator transcription factor [Burkholderia pseudomultivorans]EGD01676.1 DNA-binding response regulator, LuxR family protein [Burkholderia sp. TJI49]AOI90150.1 LuxR family transcriptional regulator [Burkholderia pseudomultivorans]KVC40110.1 LuxR family transcriptional regulator [Burkholderia pseudomultivorans]KWF06922.1 LuxR family transcriptional regulator [Burkholderia pseudomultivorans]KWF63737.1 LuxR family transcriptional regulator [Burkholderia pseudomultivorans]
MSKIPNLTRVAVADDHPIVQRAVAECLNALPGFQVVATATSGGSLLTELTHHEVDLIVTDYNMQQGEEDKDGLRLVSHLLRVHEGTPVVVFTMLTNPGVLTQLCRMGVAGLVGKDEELTELGQVCLRVVRGGKQCLSSGMEHRLAAAGTVRPGQADFQSLTQKELEVVRLFATGMSLTDIARMLNRSLGTVATQKRSAMRKLHVETNVDLVSCAREQGLV